MFDGPKPWSVNGVRASNYLSAKVSSNVKSNFDLRRTFWRTTDRVDIDVTL